MKKVFVLLTGFFLSTGIVMAGSSDSDCSDEDVKAITLTANQQG